MSNISSKIQSDKQSIEDRAENPRKSVVALLRSRGVSPTSQRVAIGMELLLEPTHLCAEDIARRVADCDESVSRATVYNTLRCFVEHGLVRQVNVGADRVFYDSNTMPHHHFYDPESGELTDIATSEIEIASLPTLPEGRELEAVDLVIRLKPTESTG